MKALVVYESMFGNTRAAAQAVARGLEGAGVQVDVVEVVDAPATLPSDLALLVIGAPTHAFSLSRSSTRQDAVTRGASASHVATGVREWLTAVSVPRPTRLAVFDTRSVQLRRFPQAAGSNAARLARPKGLKLVRRPGHFIVVSTSGPLGEGEVERAEQWGRDLAAAVGKGELRPTAN